ncbi:MAG: PLDc N-terminal domain-containing protein, partial [Thiohalobacterales bacterium]|nr:PLDc N-terminal domain-containing protein [Thiohalobacterales bacterium]
PLTGNLPATAVATFAHRRDGMEVGSGLFGILVLIADIWAILNIFQSPADNLKKALWIALVVLLPLLGVIIWFFAGPRSS